MGTRFLLSRPTPVAWGWAASGSEFGSFILFEGSGRPFCQAHLFCLDAYGRPHQDQYENGFPSSKWSARAPVRITDQERPRPARDLRGI